MAVSVCSRAELYGQGWIGVYLEKAAVSIEIAGTPHLIESVFSNDTPQKVLNDYPLVMPSDNSLSDSKPSQWINIIAIAVFLRDFVNNIVVESKENDVE